MTEEERKVNIELSAALRGFDPPGEDLIEEGPGVGPPGEDPGEVEDPDEVEDKTDIPGPEAPKVPSEPEGKESDPGEDSPPDFSNPSQVVFWYGKQIVHLLGLMRREKASSRLRCLNSSIDSWSKAVRLAIDSSELEAVKADLLELRRQIESKQPLAVVRE